MVSGHQGAEGGRSDIHPGKMEINAQFDKRKQTIYVYPEELTASAAIPVGQVLHLHFDGMLSSN